MHSFITFKATRKPHIIGSGLPKDTAITAANELYDTCKMLSDQQLLVSGVTVMVMTDEEALACVEAGHLKHDVKPQHQCGGW
jgi:hypothetical protein